MQKNKGNATVGVIIVILILIIGGYFLYKNSLKEKIEQPKAETVPPAAVSSDLSGAEQDLNAINLEGLDQGI